MLLDFKKAFDSVSWEYAAHTIQHLSPSCPTLAAIVDSLYQPHTTQILGRTPDAHFTVPVTRGVKQGDPASPLIFDLVIEQLFNQLHQAPTDGLVIQGKTIKAQGYADDTNLFDSMVTIDRTIEVLLAWSAASGVEVNFSSRPLS
jgi:hypothetical protein